MLGVAYRLTYLVSEGTVETYTKQFSNCNYPLHKLVLTQGDWKAQDNAHCKHKLLPAETSLSDPSSNDLATPCQLWLDLVKGSYELLP